LMLFWIWLLLKLRDKIQKWGMQYRHEWCWKWPCILWQLETATTLCKIFFKSFSPLHFRSAWKSLPQVLLKHVTQNYATIFHRQQSWTDLHCYSTCTCTAMVYTGWADSLVQCFSTAVPRPGTGPWHQLYRAARICHFSFLSIFHE
jgi:hypothetical protein